MDHQETILALAQAKPLLPVHVAKALKTNSLFASAMLSELASKGRLHISRLKIGSSPLYYIPEKAAQLQDYAGYLNEKDQRTFQLLKTRKVLRDMDLDPLTRVSVKEIKDFSRPLEVTLGDKKEIFWKFYLTGDEEAAVAIKQLLQGELAPQPPPAPPAQPVAAPEQQTLVQQQVHEPPQPVQEAVAQQKTLEPPKPAVQAKPKRRSIKQALKPKPAPKQKRAAPVADAFMEQLITYFAKNSIRIIEQNTVRKNAESDFIIEMDSPVGPLTYYCKAKNKKRVSDADLSAALVQGQLKKLPVAFITTGQLSKKADEVLKQLSGLTVKTI